MRSGRSAGCGLSGRRLRPLITLLVAVLFGFVLAAAPGIPGLLARSAGQVALACGSGNPVMRANGLLATLDPSTFNSGTDLPDTGGIFALDYVTGKSIAFGENLDYIGATPPADLKLRWKFGDSATYVNGAAPSHTYTTAGTYLVWVEYYDTTTNSWQFFDYAHIHVVATPPPANPPVAHASASATSVEISSDITLDATGSKSQDGSSLTYTWDFNDGTRTSGVKVSHQYVLPGRTLVQLTVADGRGAKAVDTLNLMIVPTNGLPTAAVLASATTIAPGGTISFDASQSHPPSILPNDRIVKFVWAFGDGTPAQTTTDPTISHTYAQAGSYTMTLQAYDEQDAAGTTTVSIRVGSGGNAGGASPGHGVGVSWPIIAFPLIGLAVIGYFAVQAQRRRNALIAQRQRAMQLARARRVTVHRPIPPRQQGPRRRTNRPPRPPGRPR
jgi:PKD repeat protein